VWSLLPPPHFLSILHRHLYVEKNMSSHLTFHTKHRPSLHTLILCATECVKDRGLQSQKYQYDNFLECLFGWLDFSPVEKKIMARSFKNLIGLTWMDLCSDLCPMFDPCTITQARMVTRTTIIGTLCSRSVKSELWIHKLN